MIQLENETEKHLHTAYDIMEHIDEMGHDDDTVIPIWPRDCKMDNGKTISFKDYPQLTVGVYRTLINIAAIATNLEAILNEAKKG